MTSQHVWWGPDDSGVVVGVDPNGCGIQANSRVLSGNWGRGDSVVLASGGTMASGGILVMVGSQHAVGSLCVVGSKGCWGLSGQGDPSADGGVQLGGGIKATMGSHWELRSWWIVGSQQTMRSQWLVGSQCVLGCQWMMGSLWGSSHWWGHKNDGVPMDGGIFGWQWGPTAGGGVPVGGRNRQPQWKLGSWWTRGS